MHLNSNLKAIDTVSLVKLLKRLERKSLAQRQREALATAIRWELECRAAVRATQFGIASIHG